VDVVFVHPGLVIEKADYPTDIAEANQLARTMIERHVKYCVQLNPDKTPAEKEVWVASIMERLVFGDDGFVKEQYPVLKPRPVSQPIHSRNDGPLM
jgi:hypothetical protein